MSESHQLTAVELELMEILWRIGQGSVHDVMAQMPANRTLAYTSVSTILRILQQKKIVSAEKNQRQHVYLPLLTKQNFAKYAVKKMVKQIFSDSTVELVAYLVNRNELSAEEIASIQKLLTAKKKELV